MVNINIKNKNLTLILIFLFVIVIGNFLFLLFSPVPSEKDAENMCLNIISVPVINKDYFLNCDSIGFLAFAKNPKGLIETDHPRQAKPGIVVLAWAFHFPFKPLASFDVSIDTDRGSFKYNEDDSQTFLPYYFSYLVINVLILLATMYIAFRLFHLSDRFEMLLLLGILSFIVINPLSRAFFFSPHTQLFHLLYAVAALYVFNSALQGKYIELKKLLIVNSILGIAMLFYSSVSIVWFMQVCGSIIYAAKERQFLKNIWKLVVTLIVLIAPTLIWMLIVIQRNGHFYNHEVEQYNQVVWIFTALEESVFSFLKIFLNNCKRLFIQLFKMSFPMVLLFLGILGLVVILKKGKILLRVIKNQYNFIVYAILIAIIFISFYALVGITEWRFVISSWVVMLLLFSRILIEIINNLDKKCKIITGSVTFLGIILHHIHTITYFGYFS